MTASAHVDSHRYEASSRRAHPYVRVERPRRDANPRHAPEPHPADPARVCVAVSIMTELAQAEEGWYGHARTMDSTRSAHCDDRATAHTARWPNGRALRSAHDTWLFPDGTLAMRGGTFYYPSGRVARSMGNWYYPDGRVALHQGRAHAPNGQQVRSLRDVVTETCGPHDPRCERNVASAAGRHPVLGDAALVRFAWQSRDSSSRAPRPYRARSAPVTKPGVFSLDPAAARDHSRVSDEAHGYRWDAHQRLRRPHRSARYR